MAATANGTGGYGPGFFAPSIEELLKQRAEWLDSLGDKGVLRSDDLSSQSSEWDGEEKDEIEEKADSEEKKVEEAEVTAAPSVPENKASPIDETPFNFEETKKYFSAMNFEIEDDDPVDLPLLTIDHPGTGGAGSTRRGSMTSGVSASSKHTTKTTEPLSRRLARVRGEAEALCMWADGHQLHSVRSSSKGELVAVQEAEMLGQEMWKIAGLFRQAESAHAIGPEAASKRVWLPPTEDDKLHMVERLIEYNRFAQSHHEGAPGSNPHGHSNYPVRYEFSAKMGKEGGWLAAAENEVLGELESRLEKISKALGQRGGAPAGGSEDESLAGTMIRLQRRLDTLQNVNDAAACDRMISAARLLSSDIDMAISEAQHLESVEADAGPDLSDEDTLAQQIGRLHDSLFNLDAVVVRAADISKELQAQEELYDELANFSRDLAGAEAQAKHAAELLEAAQAAAEEMKKTANANKTQLEANVKSLEKKLAEWKDRVAKAEAAKESAANEA